jgi:hypothetical protein
LLRRGFGSHDGKAASTMANALRPENGFASFKPIPQRAYTPAEPKPLRDVFKSPRAPHAPSAAFSVANAIQGAVRSFGFGTSPGRAAQAGLLAGGPAGLAANGVMEFGKTLLKIVPTMLEFAKHTMEANRAYAELSPRMAQVFAVSDVKDFIRAMKEGDELAESARQLAESEAKLKDDTSELSTAYQKLKNILAKEAVDVIDKAYNAPIRDLAEGAGEKAFDSLTFGLGSKAFGAATGGKSLSKELGKALDSVTDDLDAKNPIKQTWDGISDHSLKDLVSRMNTSLDKLVDQTKKDPPPFSTAGAWFAGVAKKEQSRIDARKGR